MSTSRKIIAKLDTNDFSDCVKAECRSLAQQIKAGAD